MSTQIHEIGGYLELEHYQGESLHSGSITLDCGRNCLLYAARLRKASAVWLPDLLRHTLRDALERGAFARERIM